MDVKKQNIAKYGYEVQKVIGDGAYGIVYWVKDIATDKDYAIKYYDKAGDQELTYDIIRETSALIKLNASPHTVDVKEIIVNEHTFIVMEYGGLNLRRWRKKVSTGFIYDRLRFITYQMIVIMNDMHKHGVIHRDLKPDNVLISKFNCAIKICDFGSSKQCIIKENNTPKSGTVNYKAPELFINNRTDATKADVWSVACLLYELARGEILFKGKEDLNVLMNILRSIPVNEEDFANIGFNTIIDIKQCNLDNRYKLCSLYGIKEIDQKIMKELDDFKSFIQKMLILNPSRRPSFEDLLKDPYLTMVTTMVVPDKYIQQFNHVHTSYVAALKNVDDFYVRQPLKIDSNLRIISINLIVDTLTSFRNENSNQIHLRKVILLAIDIFDKIMGGGDWSSFVKDILLTTRCCTVIASKFLDKNPIGLRKFRSIHEIDSLVMTERHIMDCLGCNLYFRGLNHVVNVETVNWEKLLITIENYTPLVGMSAPALEELFQ